MKMRSLFSKETDFLRSPRNTIKSNNYDKAIVLSAFSY